MADCASKLKSNLHRHLTSRGSEISISAITVTHKQHIEVEQGALIKEMDQFEMEVLGESLQKFSALTVVSGMGCRVENISELKNLTI